MLDIAIKNARIVDGTGNPWRRGDVGVKDGRIVAVGRVEQEAATTLDAAALCCAPGFIDPHAHDEGYALTDEAMAAKLGQGVTTDVSGNCGLGLAPVNPAYARELAQSMALLSPPADLARYATFEAFLAHLESLPHSLNLAFLVGFGPLRIALSGKENRPLTSQEQQIMEGLLRESLESGAAGLSIGMLYPPGNIASRDELVGLCRVLKKYDRMLTIHIRDEADQVIASVAEAIELAKLSGAAVNISHHKALGLTNWGKVDTTLEMIEDANRQGFEIGFDQYPYNANCTGLSTLLPPSYLLSCCPAELAGKLRDKAFRKTLRSDIQNPTETWDNYGKSVGLDRTLVIKADATPRAVGLRVSEYAEKLGQDPFDVACDLLADNLLDVWAVYFSIGDDDIAKVMRNVRGMVGSDGIYAPGGQTTHPRISGTMPRVLGRYVRELKVLGLEEAVRKMTSLPARRMRLGAKGLLVPGFDADITLFDPDTVKDNADFVNDSYAANDGIACVIVGGKIAMQDNRYTGAASGRVIRALG